MMLVFVVILLPMLLLIATVVGVGLSWVRPRTAMQMLAAAILLAAGTIFGIWGARFGVTSTGTRESSPCALCAECA